MFIHKGTDTDLFILQTAKNLSAKLPGNQVLVTSLDQSIALENRIHKGWVHHVDVKRVYLKLDEKFLSHFKEGMRFNVNFTLNRVPLRVQHRAVSLVCRHRLKELLFPTGQLSSHHSHLHRLSEVEKNPEQCLAIQHIVAGSAKPAPYLVFGPPGTVRLIISVRRL
ncbi:putative helicase mov-10-B.1 [Pempheris klunzingeri]|uniref:putative helicase mov-10-B.1 n=1 Tax=Pempheris klunzingeri TaxID=3127111 RepID=UPI00397F4F85